MTISNYPWAEDYMLAKAGAAKDFKEEWEWYRYQVGGKMFGALCGNNGDFTLLTLKCEPDFNDWLRRTFPDVLPGYYMNKVHWNSVKLDGDTPDEIVREMIDRSYTLVFGELSKKTQAAILAEAETATP